MLSHPSFVEAAQQLVSAARDAARPAADGEVRGALTEFAAPSSRMLLLVAGLHMALDGELDAPPAAGQALEARPGRPCTPTPSPQDAPAPELYGRIRAELETPIVNSLRRSLAGRGLPQAAWNHLGPRLPPPGRPPTTYRTERPKPPGGCPGR